MTNETETETLANVEALTDDHRLTAVVYGYGSHALDFWDDGYGPLWIYRESLGPVGIVRARTWEQAWECVVDEIMYDADPSALEGLSETDDLPEGLIFRNNGVPSNPKRSSAIAAEDQNGSALDRLTAELAADLQIVVTVEVLD